MSGPDARERARGADHAVLVYLGGEGRFMAPARRGELGLKRVPPLGLLYLAAVLEDAGVDVEVWDRAVDPFDEARLQRAASREDTLFLGFYSDTAMRPQVTAWIRRLRRSGVRTPILVGGPAHPDPGPFLDAGADVVCQGEGEETVVELVEHLRGDRPLHSILGVAHRVEGELVVTAPRPFLQDLDRLPFPERGALDMARYVDWRVLNMVRPFTTMITSRGCPRRCSFCAVPTMAGTAVRQRSVDNVLAELDHLVSDHGVRYVGFRDDYFGYDRAWLEDFCARLERRHYDLRWSCQTHPELFAREPRRLVEKLQRAGCGLLIFGLQSVDRSVLRSIHRSPREPEWVDAAIDAARRARVLSVLEFIVGLPGETRHTVRANLRFALACRPHYAAFYPLRRIQGSEIHGRFGDDPICELSDREIQRLSAWAQRRFYTDPRVLVNTGLAVLRNRPTWIRHGARYLWGTFRAGSFAGS